MVNNLFIEFVIPFSELVAKVRDKINILGIPT